VVDHLGQFSGGAAATGVALFVFGHIIAVVLAGIALYRSRAVARWIAVALIVSQPLHFVAFVVPGNRWLDAAAYGLTALGFGAAGWAFRRGEPAGDARVVYQSVEYQRPALLADLT
jgi:hypothetical protein